MYTGGQHGAAALNALDFYLAGVLSSHGGPPPGGGGMAEGELVMEGRGASGTGGGWGGLRTVQVCVCVYVYVCMRLTSHTSQCHISISFSLFTRFTVPPHGSCWLIMCV
jgi:hypothetical protein